MGRCLLKKPGFNWRLDMKFLTSLGTANQLVAPSSPLTPLDQENISFFALRLLKAMWWIQKFIFSPPDPMSKPLVLHYHKAVVGNCLNKLIYPAGFIHLYLKDWRGDKEQLDRGVWSVNAESLSSNTDMLGLKVACNGEGHCLAGTESPLPSLPFSPPSSWSSPHR